MNEYIWQKERWPLFYWDSHIIDPIVSQVPFLQGQLLGKMTMAGLEDKQDHLLTTLSEEIHQSSEIEGESFPLNEIRSSLAGNLGIEQAGISISDHRVEGTVQLILDAVNQYNAPLSEERLFRWQAALFPGGISGVKRIVTAQWRDDSKGPMQVISGSMGKEKIHYQAPQAQRIPQEMKRFLKWFNEPTNQGEWIIKSALSHLWFVTLHPFEDGNGRIARVISEMALSRSDQTSDRYYSMSGEINKTKKEYYAVLERAQKGNLNCTEWIEWYLKTLCNSLEASLALVEETMKKKRLWDNLNQLIINDRQKKMLIRLTSGFKGNLTSSKWAKICKCSQDTATRDINNLLDKGVLIKSQSSGRSTHYLLNEDI